MTETWDALVIGGGFYGVYLAEYLAARLPRVLLCEREAALMSRASYANQARVHNGYHYPRSVLTAVRSRVNYPRFLAEFPEAIQPTHTSIYAVGKRLSKISGEQFFECMKRIGASIRPAPKAIADLFDSAYIEAAFLTQESTFNSVVLRQAMSERLARAGVEVRLRTTVRAVAAQSDAVSVTLDGPEGTTSVSAGTAFCCGYAQLNSPGVGGGLPRVPLKHELTEMALVEPPAELRNLGVTVMDGPFFSLMPFPARGLHTLSHVRYTPHSHWFDDEGDYRMGYQTLESYDKQTAFPLMVRDAARYLPSAARCVYRDSLWEVKTVLPKSEVDDSRPILFRPHFGIPNYHLVLGGKIDGIYDVLDVVGQTFGWAGA